MYNKIILAGNLTRDIEIRYTQSGSAIGNTGIASTRKFKSATGEQKEEVLFVDLTFFGRSAEIANQYLRKGSKILVDGRLKLDQWTAQDGTKRSKHGVTVENMTMLGNKNDNPQAGQPGQAPQTTPGQAPNNSGYNHGGQAPSDYAQATPQNNMDSDQRHNVAGGMNKPAGHTPAPNIPAIDINEDEIPF